jgi:hypothetical protein
VGLLAAVLVALNALWDAYGLMTGQMRPSTVSLFVNVVATLFVIAVLNENCPTLLSPCPFIGHFAFSDR